MSENKNMKLKAKEKNEQKKEITYRKITKIKKKEDRLGGISLLNNAK